MRVVSNNQVYTVGWKYGTYYQNLTETDFTDCIVRDGKGTVLAEAKVVRWIHDPFDKEKARTASLTKVLRNLFPTAEVEIPIYAGEDGPTAEQIQHHREATDLNAANKQSRADFWKAYLTRNDKNVVQEAA